MIRQFEQMRCVALLANKLLKVVGSMALTECIRLRYDRVLWKSAGGQWRPKRIELIGTAPMKGLIVRSTLPQS